MIVRHTKIDRASYARIGDAGRGGQLWEFESPGDLAGAPPSTTSSRGRDRERSDEWYQRWQCGDMITTVEGNRDALRAGRVPARLYEAYLEARRACEPAVQEAGRIGNTTRRRRRYGDEGDELNIDRMAAGDPMMWERRKRGAKKRVIKIGLRFGGYSWTDREDKYIASAATGCAMADALAIMGYGVEVIGFDVDELSAGERTECIGEEWVCAVRLKASDEPLDVQRVLTSGLVAMSRTFWYGYRQVTLGCGPDQNGWIRKLSGVMKEALGLDMIIEEDLGARPDDVPSDLWDVLSEAARAAQRAARLAFDGDIGESADEEMRAAGDALDELEDLEEAAGSSGSGGDSGEADESGDGRGKGGSDGAGLGASGDDDDEPSPHHHHEPPSDWGYGGPPGWAGIA